MTRRRPRGFSTVPGWVWIPAALGALVVVLPVLGMLARVDGGGFLGLIAAESSRAALWLSLRTATVSTALCVLLGTPMALVLARGRLPGARLPLRPRGRQPLHASRRSGPVQGPCGSRPGDRR